MDISNGTWSYHQDTQNIIITARFLDLEQLREFSRSGELPSEIELTTLPMSKVQFVITKKIRFTDAEERYAMFVLDSDRELYLLERSIGDALHGTSWENIFMDESPEDESNP